jgi:two-component system nitrate/nitrite response regulator NarL
LGVTRTGWGFPLPRDAHAVAIMRIVPVTVLIVDDDVSFRALAARAMQAHGLTVVGEAGAAEEGAEAARRLRPDAVLVDVGLPDGSGIALAADLAALPWSPQVVVISSDAEFAGATRPGPNGTQLPFVTKETLASSRLAELLGARP